jgi:plasmid maintenance system antidote protein VapI
MMSKSAQIDHVVNSKKILANEIDRQLKELRMERQEFARLMNAQPSNVTKWLSGNHNFTLETLLQIERVLGFSIFIISINKVQDSKETAFSEWINKAYISIEELHKIIANPPK